MVALQVVLQPILLCNILQLCSVHQSLHTLGFLLVVQRMVALQLLGIT